MTMLFSKINQKSKLKQFQDTLNTQHSPCETVILSWWRGLSLNEHESYAGGRFISPGRATLAREVNGESPG